MVLGLSGLGDLPVLFMQFLPFEQIIFDLERFGFFQFILPFLLMFAVVFGVMSYLGIFGGNKSVNVMIALVFGLLAIRFPIYSDFLAIISPKLGIGLVIILGLVILTGLFNLKSAKKVWAWILLTIGAVIFIVILVQTYSAFQLYGYGSGYFSDNLISYVVMIVLLIGIIVAIVSTSGNKDKKDLGDVVESLWSKASGS